MWTIDCKTLNSLFLLAGPNIGPTQLAWPKRLEGCLLPEKKPCCDLLGRCLLSNPSLLACMYSSLLYWYFAYSRQGVPSITLHTCGMIQTHWPASFSCSIRHTESCNLVGNEKVSSDKREIPHNTVQAHGQPRGGQDDQQPPPQRTGLCTATKTPGTA